MNLENFETNQIKQKNNNDNFTKFNNFKKILGEQLDSRQCEALEEILKRVLFRLIDLDSCNLDGDVSVARTIDFCFVSCCKLIVFPFAADTAGCLRLVRHD